MRHAILAACCSALSLMPFAGAAAAVVWDEAIDGDLSTDPGAPTPLELGVGSNEVLGTVVSPGIGQPGTQGNSDPRDYVTFAIGSGLRLTAIVLTAYTDVATGQPGDRGFNAINLGSTSFIPNQTNADEFLAGNHVDPLIGFNLFADFTPGETLVGDGFTGALGAGTYSYLIQQTGPELTAYGLDFQVEQIPLPASAWLLAGALGGLIGFGRPRR